MAVYWYALQSKPNKEDALFEQLQMHGVEAFFPRIQVNPVNPRAKKIKAYFPGYMFVHTDLDQVGLSFFQWMPFARGMVTFDMEPATVPEALIHSLQRRLEMVNTQGRAEKSDFQKGETVFIHNGPFAGYEAIFDLHLSGSERVRVLIKLLSQRQVPLDLYAGQIRKETSSKKPSNP